MDTHSISKVSQHARLQAAQLLQGGYQQLMDKCWLLLPEPSDLHLLVNGMKDSSVVCNLHFSTPTSLLIGNDFSGFFKPICDSVVKSFLSTFGWVWKRNTRPDCRSKPKDRTIGNADSTRTGLHIPECLLWQNTRQIFSWLRSPSGAQLLINLGFLPGNANVTRRICTTVLLTCYCTRDSSDAGWYLQNNYKSKTILNVHSRQKNQSNAVGKKQPDTITLPSPLSNLNARTCQWPNSI